MSNTACKYYTERTLGWMLNNKVIVFLSLLSFCLFVSTLAMAGQKNRAVTELEDLKNSLTTVAPSVAPPVEEEDNNENGDEKEDEPAAGGTEEKEEETPVDGTDDKEDEPAAGGTEEKKEETPVDGTDDKEEGTQVEDGEEKEEEKSLEDGEEKDEVKVDGSEEKEEKVSVNGSNQKEGIYTEEKVEGADQVAKVANAEDVVETIVSNGRMFRLLGFGA